MSLDVSLDVSLVPAIWNDLRCWWGGPLGRPIVNVTCFGPWNQGGGVLGISVEWGKLLFELPVYRVSPEQWHQEKDDAADRLRRMYETDEYKVSDSIIRGIMWETHGGVPFPYNQAIGWLRMIWDGPGAVIKAYAYRMRGRRFDLNFKPRAVEWIGKAFELWFVRDDNSETIAREIRSAILDTVRRGGSFPGRWIDLEAFDTLAPVIDFRRLIGLSPGC